MGYVLIVLYAMTCMADNGRLIPMFFVPALIFLLIWALKYRNHAPQLYTFRIVSLVFTILSAILALGAYAETHSISPSLVGYAIHFIFHLVCYLLSNNRYHKLMKVKP